MAGVWRGSRKLRVHIFKHTEKQGALELGQDHKPPKPTLCDVLPSEGSITSPHSTTIWGPSVPIHEPMQDISHSDHCCACLR